jgi:pyruvate/2-oxoglutarate dehydrogenase complex dihydrolipoamide acyltransferase (E2) component
MDIGRLGMRKHHVKALVEIDVTDARKKIRAVRNESRNPLSFTSWALKCIADAIDEYPEVHALRKGRKNLIMFDEVDVSLLVEKEIGGTRVPIPMVIRGVNHKGITDICNEIEHAKSRSMDDEKDFVLEQNRQQKYIRLFAMLPQFLRLIIWRIALSSPFRVRKMMGTVVVTSVGMMGRVSGWLIPYSIHPACFALGSVVKKPGVAGNNIGIREFLEMTILLDHDVIDGAPAARFVARLSELMEKGHGLYCL